MLSSAFGSSPLARGALVRSRDDVAQNRFIPARAGSTLRPATRQRCNPVHPRSRGEHPDREPREEKHCGSSPLARGAQVLLAQSNLFCRFIPARAGSTGEQPAHEAAPPVHPRSRGEHGVVVVGAQFVGGSSPLARGALDQQGLQGVGARFIPARAGSTGCGAGRPTAQSVHPRSRGEHAF